MARSISFVGNFVCQWLLWSIIGLILYNSCILNGLKLWVSQCSWKWDDEPLEGIFFFSLKEKIRVNITSLFIFWAWKEEYTSLFFPDFPFSYIITRILTTLFHLYHLVCIFTLQCVLLLGPSVDTFNPGFLSWTIILI